MYQIIQVNPAWEEYHPSRMKYMKKLSKIVLLIIMVSIWSTVGMSGWIIVIPWKLSKLLVNQVIEKINQIAQEHYVVRMNQKTK